MDTSWIEHPVSSKRILGLILKEGELIKNTDVYASTTGNWDQAPCPGLTLGQTDVIWVRPNK